LANSLSTTGCEELPEECGGKSDAQVEELAPAGKTSAEVGGWSSNPKAFTTLCEVPSPSHPPWIDSH